MTRKLRRTSVPRSRAPRRAGPSARPDDPSERGRGSSVLARARLLPRGAPAEFEGSSREGVRARAARRARSRSPGTRGDRGGRASHGVDLALLGRQIAQASLPADARALLGNGLLAPSLGTKEGKPVAMDHRRVIAHSQPPAASINAGDRIGTVAIQRSILLYGTAHSVASYVPLEIPGQYPVY